MKNLIFADIASASRKCSFKGITVADQPSDTASLPRYAPETRGMFGFRCDLLLDYLVAGTLCCELDDPGSEPMPVIGRQPVGVRKDAYLPNAVFGFGQSIHFSDIIIVKLGVVPGRHGYLCQAIDRTGRLPVDQRNGLAVS